MPIFSDYPALRVRAPTFDLQGIQRRGLENQLLQSELQQAQNPQPDPALQLQREKFEFSQDKDQRAQGLQRVKVLGQYAGAAARASGVQRVIIHGEAVKYAQANGISTDGWRDPSDPDYVAWAQAQQARAGEAEKQAGGLLSPEVEAQKIRISQASKAPEKRTSAIKNAEALDLIPGTAEYEKYVRDVTLKPLVSIGGQETERQKKYGGSIGTYYGELYTGLQNAAREGRKQSANLDRLDQLLDQTETGFGREFVLKVLKAGETLGLETAGIETGVAPGEAAMALSNEMALQLRNPAGGAGMPGQLSDKDREFLVSMVPGLGQTRAGRKLLIRARKRLAKRAEDVAEMARKYHRGHGAIDAGFEDELAEWSEKNPLFTAEDFSIRERARLPTPQSAAARDALSPGTYYQSPDGQVRRTLVR